MKADLHCHSTCSDGSLSPIQLIDLAKEKELSGLSITDHDTIQAYKTALPYAQKNHLKLISGIEFSASHLNTSVHILGYAFNLDSPAIAKLCETHKARREDRNLAIIEKLKQMKMPITLGDYKTQSIGRPHIAKAMVQKGYVPSVSEAFKRYLGENKACYVSGKVVSAEETIDTIHQANGFAVIAHPHLIMSQKVTKSLLKMPFDGIECYYSRFPLDRNQKWLQIAHDKHWLITGGSDFHGENTPNVSLGSSWVGEEHFQVLYKRFIT